MPKELPFAPVAVNATRINPKETLTSQFTGHTQEIASDAVFWQGDILLPPMQGEQVRQWRKWVAELQSNLTRYDDGTVWIPIDVEKFNNTPAQYRYSEDEYNNRGPNEYNEKYYYVFCFETDCYIEGGGFTQAQQDKLLADLPVGGLVQLKWRTNENISCIRTIIDCIQGDPHYADPGISYRFCWDREFPYYSGEEHEEYVVEYGNPKVRAQLLGQDVFGVSFDYDRITRPTRIRWQEAVSITSMEYEDQRT